MNCDEIKKMLINYPDDEINPEERKVIEEHLAVCPSCREEYEAFVSINTQLFQFFENTATKASPSPNALALIKARLALKRSSRIPSIGAIRAKVAGWGRKLWARPLWQRAVSVATVAAITAALVVTQLVIGTPGWVLSKAAAATERVQSFHVVKITENNDGSIERFEGDYVSPDRSRFIRYEQGIKLYEVRRIGDMVYSWDSDTNTWRVLGGSDASYTIMRTQSYAEAVEPEYIAQKLRTMPFDVVSVNTETMPDEAVNGVDCKYYKTTVIYEEQMEFDPYMEVWVGKGDYLVQQSRYVTPEYTSTITYSKFDEPVEIAEPLDGIYARINLADADASFLGENANSGSGRISSAGDVNGDGYDDFLIGAPNLSSGYYDAGRTYLVLGKATGWAMDVSMANADASFISEYSGDSSGSAVAAAGDVNGDGYDDFLIGADGNDEGGDGAGQVYLILGKATSWAMDTSLANADASFIGEHIGDGAGYVAAAGDVNNDGYNDFLIGAPGNDESGEHNGQTYLILGKATGWAIDTSLVDANASFIGEQTEGDIGAVGDLSGIDISAAGDVNNDGYDDFLIAARWNSESEVNAGQAYLILGKAVGWAMDTSLANADASFIGEGRTDYAGWGLSEAGDVNNDGYDDFLVGAPGANSDLLAGFFNSSEFWETGKTYLILGKATGWTMDTSLADADASFNGEGRDHWAGSALAAAGDTNNDGYDDFLIGAPEAGEYAGHTYLMLGKATGWALDTNLANADACFIGENAEDDEADIDGDRSGHHVSAAGDVNGDGYDDFLISSTRNGDSASRAGQTYLILGKVLW
ncbi:zf-HC2 domain-containing protein [Chloroflexota bacterium]